MELTPPIEMSDSYPPVLEEVARLAGLPAVRAAFDWFRAQEPQFVEWQMESARIAAPPFGEAVRGSWLAERFRELGLSEVLVDEVGNVFGLQESQGGPTRVSASALGGQGCPPHTIALSAHIDTVFPATTPLNIRQQGSRLYGPGVSDNGAGIAAMLAGELVPGETVGVEVKLPLVADSLRARAMVRYQDKLRCGLEFVGLSAEQRALIRDWAKDAKAETEFVVIPVPAFEKEKAGSGGGNGNASGGGPRNPRKKRFLLAWLIVLVLAAIGAGVLWWHWNRSWEELESGLQVEQTSVAEKPQVQVSAEVMEKLLIHRVEPTYPAEARRANLQGIIALDIVVGRDGSVASMRPLNGPDILARAAMDALRWWKFEPYRVNGEPAVVETTVAVEFKR